MIPIPAALALAGALVGAAGAWQIQSWRYTAREAERAASQAQQHAQATQEARRIEQSRSRNLMEAQNAATRRSRVLQADADRARAESERLRDHLAAAARPVPGAAPGPGAEYAAAVSELLAQCSRGYQELARAADGHASDAALMLGAWPRE